MQGATRLESAIYRQNLSLRGSRDLLSKATPESPKRITPEFFLHILFLDVSEFAYRDLNIYVGLGVSLDFLRTGAYLGPQRGNLHSNPRTN